LSRSRPADSRRSQADGLMLRETGKGVNIYGGRGPLGGASLGWSVTGLLPGNAGLSRQVPSTAAVNVRDIVGTRCQRVDVARGRLVRGGRGSAMLTQHESGGLGPPRRATMIDLRTPGEACSAADDRSCLRVEFGAQAGQRRRFGAGLTSSIARGDHERQRRELGGGAPSLMREMNRGLVSDPGRGEA